jgi:alcohol dehydrogenase class IV
MCSLNSPPECDADCTKGLKLLVPGLLKCKKSVQDLDARFSCQLGVIEAMKAGSLYGVPMGASHGIGHQLGPMGVGHGETSCILLPAVCKYNKSVNSKQQLKVQDALSSEPEVQSLLQNAGLGEEADLGDMLDAIFKFLGMPRNLKEFGIGEKQFDSLATNSLHDRWLPTNPRPITEKGQVMEILEMVKN